MRYGSEIRLSAMMMSAILVFLEIYNGFGEQLLKFYHTDSFSNCVADQPI